MGRPALNATAASLLGFLHEGPMTGWDLVAAAEQCIGNFWTLTQSQVYRELAAMAEADLIEAGPPGRRDRKPYTITERGRDAFREWINQDPGSEQIRFPLLVTLVFAGHLSEERLTGILDEHRAVHSERLARYRAARGELRDAGAASARLATLEFGVRYQEAVLGWFDELPAILGARTGASPVVGQNP